MSNNIIGLILSYVMIFIIILIAGIFLRTKLLSPQITRKIVHIGVSNWWILAMIFFDNYLYPSFGAISFIIINYFSYKKHVFKQMEDPEHQKNLGTVYFPITLLIFSILCFKSIIPVYVGAIAILVMGYSDGIAAIVGTLWGKHETFIFGGKKSLEGTISMFITSFVIVTIILSIYNPQSLIIASLTIAFIGTITELITPYGIDNLTVPLACGLGYYFIFI